MRFQGKQVPHRVIADALEELGWQWKVDASEHATETDMKRCCVFVPSRNGVREPAVFPRHPAIPFRVLDEVVEHNRNLDGDSFYGVLSRFMSQH